MSYVYKRGIDTPETIPFAVDIKPGENLAKGQRVKYMEYPVFEIRMIRRVEVVHGVARVYGKGLPIQ